MVEKTSKPCSAVITKKDVLMTDAYKPTDRTTVKRLAKRGVYDRATIHQILDEALICHVGFVSDGAPYVIPTIHVRMGEQLFVHGSPASRMLRALRADAEICVTVTLVDGLVLARSAFHHSMNYRSVVILGRASVVDDLQEKFQVLRALTEHVVPGRWQDVRLPSEQELKGTLVLGVPIEEASAKVRVGPLDDEADYQLPVWAGVVPLAVNAGKPVPDPRLPPGVFVPDYATNYRRK
jgi:nitroimidazol reductase NimA-like FMN-containing flavoprotein (pyridoxamine 5'-phosphate oxidase superfamily)